MPEQWRKDGSLQHRSILTGAVGAENGAAVRIHPALP